MKRNHPSLLRQAVVRLFLAALTAALFATLASCGNPHANDPGIDALSLRIDALSESVAGSREQAGQVAFWQFIAAALLAAAGFALIGGAALGSIARRESGLFENEPEFHPQPQTPFHPEIDHDHDEEF